MCLATPSSFVLLGFTFATISSTARGWV